MALSRVIGLVREGVIGRVLGDSGEADVYWVAFILPDFLNYLLAGGALSLVMIPLLQRAQQRGGEAEEWACFWRVSTPLALLAVGLTLTAWLSVEALTSILAPGFSEDQHALLTHLTRIIIPAQLFHLMGAALSAKLQARDQHLAPALAPLLYTGSVAVAGLTLGAQLGAEAFAWGVLIGSALGPFGCPLLALLLSDGEGRLGRGAGGPRWQPRHEEVKAYFWRALPVMLGFSIVAFDELIVKRFGTDMGEGAVAQLHYARTLMRVPMGVFGLALGMAAFPTLSRHCAQGQHREALNLLTRSLKALLLLAVLSQVALTAVGAELAALIWGRARLTDEALRAIGLYCATLSVGLWAWASHGLVARGFYALGQTWRPTLLGSLVTLGAVPLYLWGASRGPFTLCLASSGAISAYVLVLWWWARRALLNEASSDGVILEPIMADTLKLALVAVLGVMSVQWLESARPEWTAWTPGPLGVVSAALVKGGVSVGGALVVAVLLRVDGLQAVVGRFLRSARRL
jgi:putative peptidoglycan lipid II flippase